MFDKIQNVWMFIGSPKAPLKKFTKTCSPSQTNSNTQTPRSSRYIVKNKFYICGLSTSFVFCFRHQLCSPITVTTRRFPHFLLWRRHRCATSSSVMKLLVLCGWWRLCEVSSSVFRQFLTILNDKEKRNNLPMSSNV